VPAPATVAPTAGASAAPDPANLPTLQDLQAQGVSLPPLLMNLHVYDATPSLRFVMLNGLRLGEGEFTPDGIKVVAITEHGVVLDARGRRFVLPAGG
jgi:general secretion pathway protein B